MKKTIIMVMSVLLICSALIACGKQKSDIENDKNILCVGVANEPSIIDPALINTVEGGNVVVNTFAGLFKMNTDNVPVVDCAEKYTVSEDGLVYTIYLKDNLKWSDGKRITAGDFVFSIQRAAADETGAAYGFLFEVIDGYGTDELNIKADGEKIIIITLNKPCSYFLELLAHPVFMPVREDILAELGESWCTNVENYIGNGPYVLERWDRGKDMVLVKNEFYHDMDNVKYDEVHIKYIQDANILYLNYKADELDLIDTIPTDVMKSLKANNELNIVNLVGTYYITFNANSKMFSGLSAKEASEVRYALSLLIDRNYICENISQAGEIPANSLIPYGLISDSSGSFFYTGNGYNYDGNGYYNVGPDQYKGNVDEAIGILKKYFEYNPETGRFIDFPEFTFYYNNYELYIKFAEYIQDTWNSYLGENVCSIEGAEWTVFATNKSEGKFDVARDGRIADYNDAYEFLYSWTSENNVANLGNEESTEKEYSYISNGKTEVFEWIEYDQIIKQIQTCNDNEECIQLMHKAENMIMATNIVCPIYYYADAFLVKEGVEDVFESSLGIMYFFESN